MWNLDGLSFVEAGNGPDQVVVAPDVMYCSCITLSIFKKLRGYRVFSLIRESEFP